MTRANELLPTVYTPATLADRWRCSKTTIIRMIKRGDLPTLDFPLVRISVKTVEAIERGETKFAKGYVYVAAGNGLVKIGHTTDPIYRVRSIAATSPAPVHLLHSFPGTRADEKMLHKRFAEYRSHGEWFRVEGELSAWIGSGCKK